MRLIEYTLKQRGYQVLTTRNGLEGIITAQKEEPDLIILDIMLPGIDGFEVCKRLRAGSQTAKIPILVISAKIQKEDINTGFRAGADDYICKPAPPSEIISRVENLMGKRAIGQPKTVAIVSCHEVPGTTMILVNLAAALLEQGKQVTLVDIPRSQKGRKSNGAYAKHGPKVVLETETTRNSPEPGYEVLPSGIRLLHLDAVTNINDEAAGGPGLIQKVCKSNDYTLIDLPLQPTTFTASILKSSGLTVIMSDYRLVNIAEIQHAVTLFRFLGLKLDEITAVLVDADGEFPGLTLSNVKPYIEANLGIVLAGVISFTPEINQLFFLDSQTFIQSNPGHKFSQDIKMLARFITGYSYAKAELPPAGRVIPSMEKKY
jgi:CheY-like chemotaxis protein